MVNAIAKRPSRGAGAEEGFLFPTIEESRTGKSQPPRHGCSRMPIEEHLDCLLPELLGVNMTSLDLSVGTCLDHKTVLLQSWKIRSQTVHEKPSTSIMEQNPY